MARSNMLEKKASLRSLIAIWVIRIWKLRHANQGEAEARVSFARSLGGAEVSCATRDGVTGAVMDEKIDFMRAT